MTKQKDDPEPYQCVQLEFKDILYSGIPQLIRSLKEGFDANVADEDGKTILHHLAYQPLWNYLQIVVNYSVHHLDFLKKDLYGRVPLHYAATFPGCDFFEFVKYVIDLDPIAVHASDLHKIHPLHLSVVSQSSQITEYIINKGANINCVDYKNKTPVVRAIGEDNWENACCLMAYGADMSIPASDFFSPLILVVNKQYDLEKVYHVLNLTHEDDVPFITPCTMEAVIQYEDKFLFNYFWKKFDKSYNPQSVRLLTKILDTKMFTNKEWLDLLYEILETEDIDIFINSYSYLIRDVITAVYERQLSVSKILGLLYSMMMFSPRTDYLEVRVVYSYYGMSEVFESLVNVNLPFNGPLQLCLEPEYDGLCHIFYTRHVCSADDKFEALRKMCAIAPYTRCPALWELARNKVKQCLDVHLRSIPRKKACGFDYFHCLKKLGLPKVVYNQLLFLEYVKIKD